MVDLRLQWGGRLGCWGVGSPSRSGTEPWRGAACPLPTERDLCAGGGGGWREWGAPSASGGYLAWGTSSLPVAPGPLGDLLWAAGRWRVPRRGRGGGGTMRIQLGLSAGDSARKWPVWALTARPPPKMNDPRIKERRGDRGT